MIVLVDEQLFVDDDVRDVDRLALLRLACLKEHTVWAASHPRPSSSSTAPQAVHAWIQSLRGRTQREASLLLESTRSIGAGATARGTDRILVSNRWDDRGTCVLRIEEALRLLGEPLHVLVENGLRDGAFLRRVMPADWRRKIALWESDGRIRFEHAGGNSEMEAIVEYMSQESVSAGSIIDGAFVTLLEGRFRCGQPWPEVFLMSHATWVGTRGQGGVGAWRAASDAISWAS